MATQDPGHVGDDLVAAERAHRLQKVERLRARDIDPYPVGFTRADTVGEVRRQHEGLAPDTLTGTAVTVAGRLMLIRRHGGAIFARLHDQTGDIQLLISREHVGETSFDDVEQLDRGDWVGVSGTVMTTHTGELTIQADAVTLLSKALRALPDKHRGLTDPETRLRERYLDLIANPETRRIFDTRSIVVSTIRKVLLDRGFTEVETPVLDAQAGGAAARPFRTHHNALNIDMYMRIALELPLKRLVVGGFERVFEIGRVFRNEGLDTRHNPEFTLLEAYQALADYHDMMVLVETIASEAAIAANGTTMIEIDGVPVDLKTPWRRVTMAELVLERTGEQMHPSMPIEQARAICDRLHIPYEQSWGAGRLMSEVYDETGEHTLIEPTFVLDHPREVSPLARTHRDDDTLVERFEAVVGGRELANAYSELNDPVDQRARFELEAAARAAGDEEAEEVDEDYIRALEYGLPPTGGLGIGVDRLVMLIAGASAIRDVILFPAMRPETGAETVHDGVPAAPRVAPAAALAAIEPLAAAPITPDEQVVASPPRRRAARLLAWLTGAAGLLLIFSSVLDAERRLGLDRVIDDFDGRVASHVATVLFGAVLLLLAGQLRRGKHRAWVVAVVLCSIGALAALLRGPDPVGVVVTVGMVVALVWNRDAFRGRPDPGSLLDVARFVPRYLGLVLAFGVVTLLLEREHVREPLGAVGVVETTLYGLAGVDGPYHYRGRFFSDFFPAALLVLGIAGLALLCFLLFRGVRAQAGASASERERALALVHAHGDDTLDYFALRADKSYFFSRAGDAMIAYAYLGGYALVAADPIGPPGSDDRVIGEFLAFCRLRGWHAAFLAVRESDMPIYQHYGLRGVYLGDEAIIRCDRFSLDGSRMKHVRSTVRRVGRQCSFRLIPETGATPALCAQLNELRDRWRGDAAERGFTMDLGVGVSGDNPDLLLAVAFGADEHPLGFLRLAPCVGADPGWSLDLMQHDPVAPNGITEYLIAQSALELGRRGYGRLSMNFAAWGRLFSPDAQLTAVQRAQRRVAQALSPFFQITSLRDFNAKFDPDWVARSIVVEDVEAIPKVALLYASVEGFLRIPLIGSHLVPSVPADATATEEPG